MYNPAPPTKNHFLFVPPFLSEVKSFAQSPTALLSFGSSRSVTRSYLAVAPARCPLLAPPHEPAPGQKLSPHPQMPARWALALFDRLQTFLYLYCIKSMTALLYVVIFRINYFIPFPCNQPIFSDIYSLVSPNQLAQAFPQTL